ncbi:Neurotrypsin, partial [Tetrabaena socialis]
MGILWELSLLSQLLIACSAATALAQRHLLDDAASIRLVPAGPQGRLELFYNGEWGTVCDDSFDDRAATVVCRQLGYAGGRAHWGAYFGEGTGPIHVTGLQCAGTEPSLAACSNGGWSPTTCDHSEDTSVVCYDKRPVRLVDGAVPSHGRLEVLGFDGSWGAVCEQGWRPENTALVCKQLGYMVTLDRAVAIGGSAFGSGDGPVLMDGVLCTGYERYLSACLFDGWGITECDPETQLVGVDCL